MKELDFKQVFPGDSVTFYDDDIKIVDLKVNCFGYYLLEYKDGEYYISVRLNPHSTLCQ